MTKVVSLGGGVGGMTAAHELVDRGYEVEVYDMGDLPGGKAKSMYHGAADGPHGKLPAEHGFRFFPGWYKHVDDTMKRIPYPWDPSAETVFDNLTDVDTVGFAAYDHPPLMMLTRFPRSIHELEEEIRDFFDQPSIEFWPGEIEFYASKLWQIITSSHRRRLAEYEKIGWWDFVDAEDRSPAYKKYLANLPRTLVAADPLTVSTKTNGDILMQMFFDIGRPGAVSDRCLKGPTNEMWLFAWLKLLIDKGVKYYINCQVTAIHDDGKRVTGATVVETPDPIDDTGGAPVTTKMARVTGVDRYRITSVDELTVTELEVSGDYYVSGMPIEVFAPLAGTPNTATGADPDNATGLMAIDQSLQTLPRLAESVDWMSGMLIYLKAGAATWPGHFVYVDPPMALTSIFQKQYWTGIDMSKYGDGSVADILSMDISDWTKSKAALDKPLDEYPDLETVKAEVWKDTVACFETAPANRKLVDTDKVDWFLDPAIGMLPAPEDGKTMTNRTPLLVNRINTWALRPLAYTEVPNLFLASDYVRTNTDLATMEGANEAARRATNALLFRDGSDADLCKVWKLHEPAILGIWRWYDGRRFDKGLPYKSDLPWLLNLLHRVQSFFHNLF
jgi:uncharacterized protein with NAD-binding domain and iron-sulfur cluster